VVLEITRISTAAPLRVNWHFVQRVRVIYYPAPPAAQSARSLPPAAILDDAAAGQQTRAPPCWHAAHMVPRSLFDKMSQPVLPPSLPSPAQARGQ
jgi:hypothetical protein